MIAINIIGANDAQLQMLVDKANKNGYNKWISGREFTVESIKEDKYEIIHLNYDFTVLYSSLEYAKSQDIKLITIQEYIAMKKSDLKPGMVVEYANKVKHLVVEINNEINLMGTDSFNRLSYYEDDLTIADKESDPVTATNWSIDKIYIPASMLSLKNMLDERFLLILWERPKEIILTMQEIADKFGIQVEQLKIKK